MRTLDRKMLRELWRQRTQMLSIALVVATAVTTLVAMRGTYEALERGRSAYYSDFRLAHIWASVSRAPESTREALLDIPGVAAVEPRVQGFASLDLPWSDAPGQGLFVSLPERRALVNDVYVREGSVPDPLARDEVLVGELFFEANDLALGDTLVAVLGGVRRQLTIVGTGIGPDHSYVVPPGTLYPDDERYGVFWLPHKEMAASFQQDGSFNEVALRLAPGASVVPIIDAVDDVLEPYGGTGAYGREDQLSFKVLQDELNQNRTMGIVFPAVFLGVAAFLLHMVLGRLISTQRSEIGALKAVGYTDSEIGRHFLGYSVVAVAVGTALGSVAGLASGGAMVDLYATYFRFPELEYRLSARLVFIGGSVTFVAALLGGSAAVRAATTLAPAEAMRPAPPDRFARGWIERLAIVSRLSNQARFVVRNLERKPLRAAASTLGIAASVAILVVGMFMFDGVERMMSVQFQWTQREDVTVSFIEERSSAVVTSLGALPGVRRAETVRLLPVRIRSGHREVETALTGLDPNGRLRRIVDGQGREHAVPPEGVLLSSILASRLRVGAGDAVFVEDLTGHRRTARLRVRGVVDDLMGSTAYADAETVRRVSRTDTRSTLALLETETTDNEALTREVLDMPSVASVSSPSRMVENFRQQLDDSLLVAVTFLVGFASVISVAVIYNGTRIALSERGRELASLRVLGFTRSEVATLLFGEQAILTLLAIPLGWLLGHGLAALVTTAMASETYRIPLVVSSRTYTVSAGTTLVASLASAWLVRRRLDRLDLITVLKTRE